MTKKILLVAVALMATTLLSTNSSAQACSTGATLQFVGSGSSAQTNTLAYAAVNLVSGGTFAAGSYNLSTSGTATLADTRFTTALDDVNNNLWVVWDNNANCNVYAYFQTDSVVGVKNFFAYKELTVGTKTFSVAAEYPPTSTSLGTFGQNKVGGLNDTTSTVPGPVITALTTPPVPNSSTDTPHKHGLDYCGYAGTGGSASAGNWCYFNLGGTDIRPEDALYATTRALSSIPSAGGLTGLGYNNPGCLAGTAAPGTTSTQGCPMADAFGKGKLFNVVSFSFTKDPVTAATPPKYQSLEDGAGPQVVLVSNGDNSALGFGGTYLDNSSHTHYTFTNINRVTLAQVFASTLGCTGDLLPGTPGPGNNIYDTGAILAPPPGSGKPIQVVKREALSGTYNTFEFTGVRTILGSANAYVTKPTSTAWISDADSSQESSPLVVAAPEGNVYGNNPATNFGTSGCPTVTLSTGASAAPTAGSTCGDPLFLPFTHACGTALKLGVIGSGEEVQGVSGQINSGGSVVTDGIGYTFWSYGNIGSSNKVVSGCSAQTNGTYTCTTLHEHYLTVDSLDPLFVTPGGENDAAYYQGQIYQNGAYTPISANNPNGPFNLPQCGFYFSNADPNGNTESCFKLPFTHIYDGTYPLWNVLRLVTMTNVGTGGGQTLAVPAAVINLYASAVQEAADADSSGVKKALSDFVPLLHLDSGQVWTVTTPYCYPGAAGNLSTCQSTNLPTGDLNLGVFRTHFKQTNNGNNGHVLCGGVFTGVTLGASSGCLVDVGGDFGGAVEPVQADEDFYADFGSLAGYPPGLMDMHQ
ncbi:MAG: hypothetical protein WCA49_14420 [Candidatus Sulfotelmatobacter sp.]